MVRLIHEYIYVYIYIYIYIYLYIRAAEERRDTVHMYTRAAEESWTSKYTNTTDTHKNTVLEQVKLHVFIITFDYIHAYKHTHTHTHIHAHMHTHASRSKYHRCMFSSSRFITYMHTHIQTYTHTHIRAGQSITDACIDFSTTEKVLETLAEAVRARRQANASTSEGKETGKCLY
jgi:3-deoxy-D-arabino-heptulosonate 7-phosphate (DAHP) synthase